MAISTWGDPGRYDIITADHPDFTAGYVSVVESSAVSVPTTGQLWPRGSKA